MWQAGATLHHGARASLSRPLLLRSTGSRRAGSVIVAHGPSCSAACGILPDQGSNPCPLHWQADSQPLRHQGSPWQFLIESNIQLPFCSAIPHMYLSQKNGNTSTKKTCAFMVDNNWKQHKCPLRSECMNKLCYFTSMGYRSTIKVTELLLHTITWMIFTDIVMRSKRSQTHQSKYCLMSYVLVKSESV